MNVEDGEKGTKLVEVATTFLSIKKIKGGAEISMGVPEQSIYDIDSDKKMPILLMVDKEEYFKRMKG